MNAMGNSAAASANCCGQQGDKDEVLHPKTSTFGSNQAQTIFWKEQCFYNPNYVQITRGAKNFMFY